ncbi:hypothetical protein [Pseudomonas sp.]|uniref:hypothetical protein n=1 Tax=Pseudomonas sp. TaxID=306 RepID=UPI003A97840F
MHLSIIFIATAASLWGLYHNLRASDHNDITQASLLPFADDPEAANRVELATGLHCEKTFTPGIDPSHSPANYLDA